MDFSFTPEQQALQETVRRFTAEKITPLYQKREQEEVISRDLCREMGQLGLIAAELPEALGGLGQDSVTSGIIMEEVARGDINVAYVQLLGSLNGGIVASHAKKEIAQRVVKEICQGEILIALGLTEPGAGSDAAHLSLRADFDGTHYRLQGEKTSISFADQADVFIVFARTGGEGARGISAFLVPADAPGVSRSRFKDLGSEAVGRGSIFFENVKVEPEFILGRENDGFRQVMQGFDYSRALIGLQCLGPALVSLEETWKYVTERHAFGKPIAKYQGVTEPLAEAETMLTAARLLCYHTLWLRDQGKPHTAEAAMCKWWIPKVAYDCIHQCLLLHGHPAYSREMPLQQRLRDVLGLQIGDGTRQIQKMVIAREKIGRVAVPYA